MEHDSVTAWLRQFSQGDQAAARKLWDRYGPQLIELARRRYPGAFNATADEEDLVQSVFRGLWSGAVAGRCDSVQDRDALWWLLLAITRHKAQHRRTHQHRQKRCEETRPLHETHGGDSGAASNFDLIDEDQPPADLLMILDEEQQRLLAQLRDDVLRSIALWKLEGYSHDEIASKLDVSGRTVMRKVNLIRECWAHELEKGPA